MPRALSSSAIAPRLVMPPARMSLLEAMTNVVVGLLVAVTTQIMVFPILGLHASLGQNLKLALVFTGVSIARGYVLRRFFEALR